MSLKPIKLYSHPGGPNPWKVALVLEELQIPYETVMMDFADLKKDPFEKVCVNGRVPAIEDPNNDGFALWESGAIIEYLAEKYDTEGKLSYKSGNEKYKVSQWLHFQMSGQGPYYGQFIWFSRFHGEKLPSAVERYKDQIKRVVYVLDKHFKESKTEYLVGNKLTYADLAFLPWDVIVDTQTQFETKKNYPAYHAWHTKLLDRPLVKKIFEERRKAMEGH